MSQDTTRIMHSGISGEIRPQLNREKNKEEQFIFWEGE